MNTTSSDEAAADAAVARFGYCLADSPKEREALRQFIIQTRGEARTELDPIVVHFTRRVVHRLGAKCHLCSEGSYGT